MTIEETIKYFESMRNTALNDTDKRAEKCVEAIDKMLQLLDEREKLQNRCGVLSQWQLCQFCGMECKMKESL